MTNVYTRKYLKTKVMDNNMEEIFDCDQCTGLGGDACLSNSSQQMLKVFNRRAYNYVRVPTSLYMSSLNGATVFRGSFGMRWNQSSDRLLKHVGTAVVPSRGSSTRSSVTRHRPGSGSPGGAGVDIKHNSFQRYLNRKKGATVPSDPYVGDKVNPKAVVNNKVQKSSILAFCPRDRFCNSQK